MASARAATPDDYGLFTHFFAAFEPPEPTPSREWWNRSYTDAIFLEEAGHVVAYGFAYRLGRELGHVAHVVVDEPSRGRRVGRVIMDALAERLRALGCNRWSLYVSDSNAPAIALYRRCGMQVTSTIDEIRVSAESVRGLPDDPSVTVAPLSVEHDAVIERTFGLPEGRIARVRRLPGRLFSVAVRDGQVVGTISYDEKTRSTPFLCATNAAVARALISAVTNHDDIRLWVNNDAALSAALVASGGRVVRHMLQMDGALA